MVNAMVLFAKLHPPKTDIKGPGPGRIPEPGPSALILQLGSASRHPKPANEPFVANLHSNVRPLRSTGALSVGNPESGPTNPRSEDCPPECSKETPEPSVRQSYICAQNCQITHAFWFWRVCSTGKAQSQLTTALFMNRKSHSSNADKQACATAQRQPDRTK